MTVNTCQSMLVGMEKITFGDWMKKQRRRLHLRQVDVAEAIGVDSTYITKIETGKVGLPHLETRQRLHTVFGTSERDLSEAGVLPSGQPVDRVIADIDPAGSPALRASFSHIPELTDENLDKVATLIEDLYRLQELGELQNTKAGARRKAR